MSKRLSRPWLFAFVISGVACTAGCQKTSREVAKKEAEKASYTSDMPAGAYPAGTVVTFTQHECRSFCSPKFLLNGTECQGAQNSSYAICHQCVDEPNGILFDEFKCTFTVKVDVAYQFTVSDHSEYLSAPVKQLGTYEVKQ